MRSTRLHRALLAVGTCIVVDACAPAIATRQALAQATAGPGALVELRLMVDGEPNAPFSTLPPGTGTGFGRTPAVGLTLQARVTTRGSTPNWGISRVGFIAPVASASSIVHTDAFSDVTDGAWTPLDALRRGITGDGPAIPSGPGTGPRVGLFNYFRNGVGNNQNLTSGNGTFTAPINNGYLVPAGASASMVSFDGNVALSPFASTFANSTPAGNPATAPVVSPWRNVYRFTFNPRFNFPDYSPARQVTVTLSALAQWSNERFDISGTGAGPFTLLPATDAWQDKVRKTVSATFWVEKFDPPAFVLNPGVFVPWRLDVSLGQGFTISQSAISVGAITYQWQKNGVDLVDDGNVTGSATTTLSVASADRSHYGFYQLRATNGAGPITRIVAVVIIPVTQCTPADIADNGGSFGPDNVLDNGDFQLFLSSYFTPCVAPLSPCSPADIANNGSEPTPDGVLDNGDFQLFTASYFTGCGPR